MNRARSLFLIVIATTDLVAPSRSWARGHGGEAQQPARAGVSQCDASALASVKAVPADTISLETFLRSPAVSSQPDLAAAALASLWMAAPRKAQSVFEANRSAFRTAQEGFDASKGKVSSPCLPEDALLALWPRLKPAFLAALNGPRPTDALPAGPFVTLYTRFSCLQQRDCSAAKEVKAVGQASRERATPAGGLRNASRWLTEMGDDCDECG